MKKERMLLFIGVWVALLPNLGFPENWRKILFLLTGLFIILISYIMYRRKRQQAIYSLKKDQQNHVMNTFSESIPEEEPEEIEEEILITEVIEDEFIKDDNV